MNIYTNSSEYRNDVQIQITVPLLYCLRIQYIFIITYKEFHIPNKKGKLKIPFYLLKY